MDSAPPEILDILARPDALTAEDIAILRDFLRSSRDLRPSEASVINNVIRNGPASAPPDIDIRSVADRVNAGAAAQGQNPASLPRDTDPGVNPASLPRVEEPLPVGGFGDVATTMAQDQLFPEGGGGIRQDRSGRTPTDWTAEIGNLGEISPDEESAFAGMDPDMFLQRPEMASIQIARNRSGQDTGGQMTGALMEEDVRAGMDLARLGLLGGKHHARDLTGGSMTDIDTLAAAEAFANHQMDAVGSQPDPSVIYRKAMKRAGKTDMLTANEGGPVSIDEQIQFTNGALLVGAPYMSDQRANSMAAKLAAAGQDYLMKVATGKIDPEALTYPKYLESVNARSWIR